MPKPIAAFISQFVYDGRLLSQHPLDSPNCLAFIDAPHTGEERAGFSSRVSYIFLIYGCPNQNLHNKELGRNRHGCEPREELLSPEQLLCYYTL